MLVKRCCSCSIFLADSRGKVPRSRAGESTTYMNQFKPYGSIDAPAYILCVETVGAVIFEQVHRSVIAHKLSISLSESAHFSMNIIYSEVDDFTTQISTFQLIRLGSTWAWKCAQTCAHDGWRWRCRVGVVKGGTRSDRGVSSTRVPKNEAPGISTQAWPGTFIFLTQLGKYGVR